MADGDAADSHMADSHMLNLGRKIRASQPFSVLARAGVIHHGKRQAVCRCDVFAVDQGGETLCANAQGMIVRLSIPG